MKYYTLTAIVNGKTEHLRRSIFSSRDEAINYMFDYYEKHYLFDKQVNDEYSVDGDKHNIEYVCDHFNRFRIARKVYAF